MKLNHIVHLQILNVMPGTNNLLYNEVSFKASHNSHDRNEITHEQLLFHERNPSTCGCRGLEFDIWRHSDETERFFTVSHTQVFKEGPPLAWYLGLLLSWHLNNSWHDVILVTIDIKSSHGEVKTFPHEIDQYLKEYFNSHIIFRPSMLFHDKKKSLCENVIEFGWPQLGAMKDKFIFCLSGTDEWKNFYASLDPINRLCFCDKDFDDDDNNVSAPLSGNFIFFNTHVYSNDYNTWKITIPKFKGRNLIVRAYEIDGEGLWHKAQSAGASVLATNKVSGAGWAKVGNSPFALRT
jgi:hypothetical protein